MNMDYNHLLSCAFLFQKSLSVEFEPKIGKLSESTEVCNNDDPMMIQ